MKYKNILNIGLALVIGLIFAACSQSDDLATSPNAVKMQNGFYVYDVDFNCEAPSYDVGTTRAITYNWQNHATLLARFKSGSTYYQGFIILEADGWHLLSTNDFSSQSLSGTCELYYFQESNGDYLSFNMDTQCFDIYNNGSLVKQTDVAWNAAQIVLTEGTAVYTTTTANYTTTDKYFSLNATLTPLMWRMRFSGSNGTSITMPGSDNDINYCSAFNWSTSSVSFTKAVKDVSLTVSGGYTPYIYGEFKSTASNKITVKNGSDIFTRNLSASNLQAGTSGYFDIPTASNYSSKGWTKVASAQEMVLKDMLAKPMGNVNVDLKTASYQTIRDEVAKVYTISDLTSDGQPWLFLSASSNPSCSNMAYQGVPFYTFAVFSKDDGFTFSYTFKIKKSEASYNYTSYFNKMLQDYKNLNITMTQVTGSDYLVYYMGKDAASNSYSIHVDEDDDGNYEFYLWAHYYTNGSSGATNCKFVPNNFLAFTDGCVTDWTVDSKVSKGYFKVYKKTEISSMSDAAIVADLKTTDAIPASNLNSNVYYRGDSYTANSNYVLCSVGFDSSGKQGELNKYEFKTRSTTLPMAALSNMKYNSSYWLYTVTAKNNASSYYLYFNESTGVNNWSSWYLRYRIYFAIQNNELGMGTSNTIYSTWGNMQVSRDESQFSICTWAIVSGKNLGNPDSYQGYVSSAPSLVMTKEHAATKYDCVRKKDAEELFNQGKLILVKGF